MPQTKTKSKKSEKEFTPPAVAPGDVVLWRQHGRQEKWFPAVVADERGDGCLHLNVVLPDRGHFDSTRKAVYHVDDPRSTQERGARRRRDGVWRLRPQDEALRKIIPEYEAELRKLT